MSFIFFSIAFNPQQISSQLVLQTEVKGQTVILHAPAPTTWYVKISVSYFLIHLPSFVCWLNLPRFSVII